MSCCQRSVNTLVLVHRQQLLDQWRERLAMFLNLRLEEIGQIGAGKAIRTGMIDVAVIQSLYRDKEVKDFVADYGHIDVRIFSEPGEPQTWHSRGHDLLSLLCRPYARPDARD